MLTFFLVVWATQWMQNIQKYSMLALLAQLSLFEVIGKIPIEIRGIRINQHNELSKILSRAFSYTYEVCLDT